MTEIHKLKASRWITPLPLSLCLFCFETSQAATTISNTQTTPLSVTGDGETIEIIGDGSIIVNTDVFGDPFASSPIYNSNTG